MRVYLEGVGFEQPTELILTADGGPLLHQIISQYPSKTDLPWNQLWLRSGNLSLSFQTKTPLELNLCSDSRIQILAKLLGGGGDGGSTGAESRDAFLNMYKLPKADKVDEAEEKFAKWTRCQLSGEILEAPCVCDELGTLFNKDAVLRTLIEKTMPKSLSHITSLKHVIPIILAEKPSIKKEHEMVKDSSNYQQLRDREVNYHCPITGLEFNGSFHFSVHVPTGHVLSERAIKEAPQAVAEQLNVTPSSEDWLSLNGTAETVQLLKSKMLKKRQRKNKKRIRTVPKENSESSIIKKKAKAEDYAPKDASKEIYASIFATKGDSKESETFLCRSVGARGMNLT